MPEGQSSLDLLEIWESLMPSLSIDCVVFGFHDGQLKVLALKLKNTEQYALPGGFVRKDESVNEAAHRVLRDRTGLTDIFLEQFYVFGERERGDQRVHQEVFRANGVEIPDDHWLFQRFVSLGYYALVDFSKVRSTPDWLSESCDWHDHRDLPPMILDHNAIVTKALETLRLMLDHKLVGFNLLPEKFTMGELQQLYDTILDKELVRSNFQRKMLSLGIFERLEKKMTGAANKAPYLYRVELNTLRNKD